MTELERLEKLKQEAIENPPNKAKKGCSSCKKKKVVEKLPELIEDLYIPNLEDIKKAYVELSNKNLKQEHKLFINKVFRALFDEDFDFDCRECVHRQITKFQAYMQHTLKLKL